MKILILTNLYPPLYIGGYELICQTVAEELARRGNQIQVLTSKYGVERGGLRPIATHPRTPVRERERLLSAHADPANIEVTRALRIHGMYGYPWKPIHRLRRLEQHNNNTLRAAIRQHAPDLVYVWNMGGLSKSMLFTLQRTGLPTAFYVSDHWLARSLGSDVWLRWWNMRDARLPQRLARAACEMLGLRQRWDRIAPTTDASQLRFDRISFCSRALRSLTESAGRNVRHGVVIYAPVHARYFATVPAEPGPSVRRLLYVGRLAEDKGAMTALRALATLKGRFDGKLSFYGRGDPGYVNELRQFAQAHNLDASFQSSDLNEMPQVYRSHDVLLFTSEWEEPFALTPIEAMACGIPVIGTMTGGSAELFRHGENALTYAAGRADELAGRIVQFASDRPLRERCSATAHEEVRRRFATPVITDQVEAYLAETLKMWPASAEAMRRL